MARSNALLDMLHYGLPTVSGRELAQDALAIALSTGRTVYDAMCLALAIRRGSILSPLVNTWSMRSQPIGL
ncbi:MAG: hypothetical protein LAP61_08800 [Acidobacteriia bacterium]|nr:hypothetical protein [Terriglobia bacterium]